MQITRAEIIAVTLLIAAPTNRLHAQSHGESSALSIAYPITKIHGLRMLNKDIFTHVPLSSADSTNVARNIGIDKSWVGSPYAPASKETRTQVLVERIESFNSASSLNYNAERDVFTPQLAFEV